MAAELGISQSSTYNALKVLLGDDRREGELVNVGTSKRTMYAARAGRA